MFVPNAYACSVHTVWFRYFAFKYVTFQLTGAAANKGTDILS